MLKDRIKEVLKAIHANNLDIANHIGYSPSNISRLRNGHSTPAYTSAAMKKLTNGITEYAAIHGYTDELNSLLGSKSLTDYLYQDEFTLSDDPDMIPFAKYGEKLNSIMYLTNLSNSKLGRMINIDPSVISRYRNGKRTPIRNLLLADSICQALLDEIISCNLIEEAAELIGMEKQKPIDIDILYVNLRNWMYNLSAPDKTAVDSLIQTMDEFASPNISLDFSIDIRDIVSPDIISDTSSYYRGNIGIQHAVIRFLVTALSSDATELLLYSDENMSWMTDDQTFNRQWTLLMGLLIKKGVHIRIIHNINRNIPEMIEAIKSWLPLYMSGMVSSYYSKQRNGNRFAHTLFVCPDVACVESFHAIDESDILYEYHSDTEHIEYYTDMWNTMRASSETLIRIHTKNVYTNSDIPDDSYESDNIRISLNNSSVIITRTAPPYATFIILHPLMHEAFRSYLKEINHTE